MYGVYVCCFSSGEFFFFFFFCRREVLPDGILYASQESHYSVFKAARMYRMDCVKVGTLISGEIDCADLKLKLLANKDKPAILNVNIGKFSFLFFMFASRKGIIFVLLVGIEGILVTGTTVKGAVDDLDLVIQTLNECGFSNDRFYIHCDGALFGLMMPFVKRVSDFFAYLQFSIGHVQTFAVFFLYISHEVNAPCLSLIASIRLKFL